MDLFKDEPPFWPGAVVTSDGQRVYGHALTCPCEACRWIRERSREQRGIIAETARKMNGGTSAAYR